MAVFEPSVLPLKGEIMKVKCVKGFTLAGTLYEEGGVYEMPTKVATDYAEYFERSAPKPRTKKAKTQENK